MGKTGYKHSPDRNDVSRIDQFSSDFFSLLDRSSSDRLFVEQDEYLQPSFSRRPSSARRLEKSKGYVTHLLDKVRTVGKEPQQLDFEVVLFGSSTSVSGRRTDDDCSVGKGGKDEGVST